MPPGAGKKEIDESKAPENFRKLYSRAIQAVKKCGDNPKMTGKKPSGEVVSVCVGE
jgi:hypothetical protein